MIRDDEDLAIVRKQVAHVENALAALRREFEPRNKDNYRVFAEPYVDQILVLRAEIDEYIGLTSARALIAADDAPDDDAPVAHDDARHEVDTPRHPVPGPHTTT